MELEVVRCRGDAWRPGWWEGQSVRGRYLLCYLSSELFTLQGPLLSQLSQERKCVPFFVLLALKLVLLLQGTHRLA